jgi:hypothetical protein
MTVPAGTSGEIRATNGARASFAWEAPRQTATISVLALPLSVSCDDAKREIEDFGNACGRTDMIELVSRDAASDVWRIDSPDVRKSETAYPHISLRAGDSVVVSAGGCVQTGGHGDTWRLYVDPPQDASHHGLIRLPGQSAFVPIKDLRPGQAYTVGGDMPIRLGYQDDDYSDNGYWGRDPGPGGQCVNQPNAWVQITVRHAARQ